MFELLLPVALGMLGGGLGLALAGRMRRNRQLILMEADALQARGALRAAATLLEQSLKSTSSAEAAFVAEARYRLCGLYVGLGQWRLGEQVCRELLASQSELGLSGRHDVLRHLARCLEEQGSDTDATAVRAQADTLIEEIPDTAYRLFARQERLVRQGNFHEALTLQEELLTSYPERVSVATLLCYTAFTATHAGFPRDAAHYIQLALARPELPIPLQRQAHRIAYHTSEQLHDWAGVLTHARALQQLSDTPLGRKYLATALLLNNQLDEAEALLPREDIGLRLTLARLRRDFLTAHRLLECAIPGPKTTLLEATVALESGDGVAALATLDSVLETSDLRSARRAWALALIGAPYPPPAPALTDDPALCEAHAQALWHSGNKSGALMAQEALLQLPLAPAFRAYHKAVLKQWKTTL